MKNSKYWRKRTLEQEKERLAKLQRELVFSKISGTDDERQLETSNRIRRLLKIPSLPSRRKVIRRLDRKIRRIETGIYRQRNWDR